MATAAAGSEPGDPLCISDWSSFIGFLVNTGIQISLVPVPSGQHYLRPTTLTPQVSNGSSIKKYSKKNNWHSI